MSLQFRKALSGSVDAYEDSQINVVKFRKRRKVQWAASTDRSWLHRPKARDEQWAGRIVLVGMFLGFAIMFGFIGIGYSRTNRYKYKLIMHDDFSTFSGDNWKRQQQVGGFVEGSFDWTTDSSDNSWVADNILHIKPSITTLAPDLTEVDLTATGVCTSDVRADCYAIQNLTGFKTIPNVQTARLTSTRSITFGKVEVIAKFPAGDWIFSTIGLDPVDLVYGQFPASGQLDLVQIRGNSHSYVSGGRDKVDTIVHFGADGQGYSDAAQLARQQVKSYRSDFSLTYHKFGLEWTPTEIRTWLDYPSNTMMHVTWPNGFWKKANYAQYENDVNYEHLADPWTNGSFAAPYDVPFFLTLRTNVGGVNGIFADSPSKPWYDSAGRDLSMIAFQKDTSWLNSWGLDEQHTMLIKDVKMWQQIDAHVAE